MNDAIKKGQHQISYLDIRIYIQTRMQCMRDGHHLTWDTLAGREWFRVAQTMLHHCMHAIVPCFDCIERTLNERMKHV